MNLKSTLLTLTITMFAAAPVFAADVQETGSGAAKTEAAKAEVKKPVKRHNHMEEKTGMPVSTAPSGKSHSESMDKDMPMHDHLKEKH